MQFEETKKPSSKNSFAKGWAVRSTLALTLATALLAGCETPERQAATPGQTNVTTEDVAENTNRYIGQIVTIRSEPIDKIGPSTFTLEDQQFFGSEPVLVVNASGRPFVLPEDGVDIQATGEVRNFVIADVNREYNLGLDANAYTEYENRPAIIAQSLAVAPEPGELTSNPQQYYGQQLAVTGEIEEIQGANAFTLDEDQLIGGQELLVIRANPATANQPAIEDGETVAVTGTLRPFVVAELEREYGFSWDTGIQQQLEAEYTNRPVLVADGVYPSAIPDGAL
ncbi:MAG: hypothetical protein EDM05_56750 [Leptolyngbya sp. IPPAS B-1204]|nr:hypothetical protein [Elainella sp. C42_A2020_010]RNJ66392.1 MAG: hypothetical protein EDM05_25995 [Leptolyngbya sp. IPPAS B-1204]